MSATPLRLYLFFRKRYPTAFSIERLFADLGRSFADRGVEVIERELPLYNNALSNVRKNIAWAGSQVQRNPDVQAPTIVHVTGDVNSIVFGLSVPTVITIHDCNPLLRYPRWHPRYWFYRWVIFEWPARRAAAVTVISEKTRRELLQLTSCRADKLHVIPNPVDPAIGYRPADFNAAVPTILQIGTKENKNLARLARALRGLACRLQIVGEPSATDRAELDRCGIDYAFAAGVSDERVRQYYADCDLLAFASTYEGFGLPILEAQVTGRPVVTSDRSPHREIAGPGGAVLVDPEDVASIRRGIQAVIADADLRRRCTEAGRRNAALYHIDRVTDQYLALYDQLI